MGSLQSHFTKKVRLESDSDAFPQVGVSERRPVCSEVSSADLPPECPQPETAHRGRPSKRTSQPHPQLVLYLINRLKFRAASHSRHPPPKCIPHMDPGLPVHVPACLSFLRFLAVPSQGSSKLSLSSQLPVSFLEPAGKVVVVVVVQ